MKLAAIVLAQTALGIAALAADKKINMSDLPSDVQSAVRNETNGSTILGVISEQEKGSITYEVETRRDGKSRDLTFGKGGALLEVEHEVDLNSIPGPAKEAIQRKLAGGTVTKVESVTKGSIVSYEAAIKTKIGKSREVAVNADGTLHGVR